MGPRPKRTQGPHGRQSGDLAKWSNGKELVQQRSPQKGLLFESPKHHAPCESRRADRAPSDGTPALRDSPGAVGGRAALAEEPEEPRLAAFAHFCGVNT